MNFKKRQLNVLTICNTTNISLSIVNFDMLYVTVLHEYTVVQKKKKK